MGPVKEDVGVDSRRKTPTERQEYSRRLGRKTRVLTCFNNRPQPMRNEYIPPHLVQQCIVGDVPDGRLAHFREYCVGELGGERRSDAGSSVFAVMSKPNSISTVDRDF